MMNWPSFFGNGTGSCYKKGPSRNAQREKIRNRHKIDIHELITKDRYASMYASEAQEESGKDNVPDLRVQA
ncbi:hypothetical protein KSF_089690 [Reticulibacter mediterranei]|uniref:Uncharacterized protein n=1 Tax=Reticulibacter mediterranei TaxID=2778369 RepID=A0A8J3IQI9_9CHLR|nr:hypothetical protein KSF_089690 [Reticulibacter mediterranei]